MTPDGERDEPGGEPVVSCTCQGGTVSVYEDVVHVERSSSSMFEDKTIPMDEIYDVEFTSGIVTGHIQIRQLGVEPGEGGLLSHPVDENTLYFPRGKGDETGAVRDAILERARAAAPPS
ncbi:MAG: hypothetical protein ABEI96_02235 [Haloarculaceae archaeon]